MNVCLEVIKRLKFGDCNVCVSENLVITGVGFLKAEFS